ncbi:chemotaxis protein CheA [Aquabacterium sp.]|uniref:chemotaxis protein CheA n=1 Tax=Aquabacterium sp. TaxID=1872578 RepID=UPI0035B340AB
MSQSSDDEILAIAREGFLAEAQEMLRQFEDALLGLETTPDDSETLNAAFRAAHTIKGTAGLFGYNRVVSFTHEVEALLEVMRSGQRPADEGTIALLLQGRDQIDALLGDTATEHGDPDIAARSAELGSQLRALIGGGGAHAAPAPTTPEPEPAAGGADELSAWRIEARFGPDALRNGLDPLSFIRYLEKRGQYARMHVLAERIPDLENLDAESCYLGFSTEFATAEGRAVIDSAFEFALEDCELVVAPLGQGNAVGAPAAAVAVEAIATPAVAAVPVAGEPQALEQVERRAGGGDRRAASRDRRAEDTRFIRVQADKLDRLIDLIGELVIASSGSQLAAENEDLPACYEAAMRVRSLVEQARDGAMSLRMVPIGETFARFHRVVRDVSKSLGKDVELQITGGEASLDKSMVEAIADPLTHLVRNSLDHGLELPADRTAAGKSPRGTLALHAYHEAGQIVIEVSDDGQGLNRERILAKAVERGLVRPDQTLSPAEIDQLICAPGFSTKEQVTDLSGRGVGMDVVKRSIESLRGQMNLASESGRGMTTQIRLPLTLAIIDGFLTDVGGVNYVLPLAIVSECIDVPPECNQHPDRVTGYFNLRGEVLPYLDVGRFYRQGESTSTRRSLVIARDGHTRIGLIVDQLLGEHQTVIKPLSGMFRHLRAIAGSTILGSGDVALVLDVPALTDYAMRRNQGARASFNTAAETGTH